MLKLTSDRFCDLDPNGFPSDWRADKGYRGFARAKPQRRYVVRLCVQGTQYAVGTTTTQEKAAKLYDLACWKLAAFMRKPVFNFPESLAQYNDELINANAPVLHKIYQQCSVTANLSSDLTEREHREAAFERAYSCEPASDQPATVLVSAYPRYAKAVAQAAVKAFQLRAGLKTRRDRLNLSKLPALAQDGEAIETALQALHEASHRLFTSLERHASLYQSLQQPEGGGSL